MSRVARLSIAPVRSLALEHPEEIMLTEHGVAEDRRFYLIDERGFLVDRVVVGQLAQAAGHTDPDATMLRIELPGGFNSFAFGPDAKTLVTAGRGGLDFWNVQELKHVALAEGLAVNQRLYCTT